MAGTEGHATSSASAADDESVSNAPFGNANAKERRKEEGAKSEI